MNQSMLRPVGLLAASVVIVSCSEPPPALLDPGTPAVSEVEPEDPEDPVDPKPDPDPGGDTHYIADVTWEFMGGYDGFDHPDAERRTSFRIEQIISSGDMSTYQTRSSPLEVFSGTFPLDAAGATLLTGGGFETRDRGGAVIAIPDSATVANSVRQEFPEPALAAATASPPRVESAADGAGIHRTMTGAFVGPVEAAARLAQMRVDGLIEERVSLQLLRFRGTHAGTDYVFDFDEIVGAVVRTEISENGRPTVRISREYEPVPGGHMLRALTTETLAADGSVRNRTRQEYAYQPIAGR